MLLRSLVLIGLGGGVGSMLRYLTSLWVGRCFPHHFPLATFVVNMAGCPDFVIVSPKNFHQRVLQFSDALPSALSVYKLPCSEAA